MWGTSFDLFRPEIDDEGLIVDYITRDPLENRPEEHVRQHLQRLLHLQFGYPKNRIGREVPIHYGNRELVDPQGKPVRADVAVYRTAAARARKDQGAIELICETKQPTERRGHGQLVSYIFNTSADGAVWYNGSDFRIWRRVENHLHDWPNLPHSQERWDAVGRRRKSELAQLVDPRGTLRVCHERIHRRGVTDDVALTMVRILLAKWRDEERPGEMTDFYCTPTEYRSKEGRQVAALRAEKLFAEVRDANKTIFDEHEKIGGTADEIVEVMTQLQVYRLLGENDGQWDVMGAAYEQYTADEMKKEGGEFFTNRLIVSLLTQMIEVGPEDLMLDPAGGSGGFCSSALRSARRQIRQSTVGKAAQDRAVSQLKDRIFLIDKKPRLVKLAKAAMIVSGNGHRGFFCADSLGPIESLPPALLKICPKGGVTVVMTNPPWSGLVNGRIADPLVLENYQVARRWEWKDNEYQPTDDIVRGGIPPEYLFVEQCINWLAPGGRLAIVMPKGVLDNLEPALAVRHFLFRHCRVQAVINCHKNTFQPYTGSRGCLIIAQKKKQPSPSRKYKIFMAINRKIGQDSEGVPIFKKDDQGRPTALLDHDLDAILQSWRAFKDGCLKDSEFAFSIDATSLDEKTLRLNPQFYLPSLNHSLERVSRLDGNGFTVERLGDRIASRIWKGLRFKREDLEAEHESESTVRYYTPSAVFMRGEGSKLLDLSKCDAKRAKIIRAHAAKVGEILITRSGTIGRTAVVGRTLEGVVLSDDLIRVWIEDPQLRALVFSFLRSPAGQDQLRRNEYGTVQQHLEPSHVADLALPLPDGKKDLANLMTLVVGALEARERSVELEDTADKDMLRMLEW
jgi:type I restriction enzyme M protein